MNSVAEKTHTDTLLEEFYKITSMGVTSLTDIMNRVKDKTFREELTRQIETYSQYTDKIGKLLYRDGKTPKEENMMTKLWAKIGTAMNTMNDSTTSHLAQMVIEGNTMGITEGTRLMREYENTSCSEEALSIARDVIRFLEDSVEKTKAFL